MSLTNNISPDLKKLVSQSVKMLGLAVEDIYGKKLFQQIEKLRRQMKEVRGQEAVLVHAALEKVYKELKKSESEDLHRIAKAFSLMLELINTCEAAYRSHRLRDFQLGAVSNPQSLIYVFTSHPTEARSRDFLSLMNKIEQLLAEALDIGFEVIEDKLFHLLRLAVRISLANNRRPQVKDEAEQIFHTVLDQKILTEQVALKKKGIDVHFRTWVGGDKDGHPLVGPETMLQSLTLSRQHLLDFIFKRLNDYESEIVLLGEEKEIRTQVRALIAGLKEIKKVGASDGRRISAFKKYFSSFQQKLKKKNLLAPSIDEIEQLIWLYPALVLPLEVREDSELIHAALKDNNQTIARMIRQLKSISAGMSPKWYVRGFVISMCQSSEDILAAVALTRKNLGGLLIPVVPLFENEQGLTHAVEILSGALKGFNLISEHKQQWGGRFEVMVGYSDSSKENGVLPGRLLIQEALMELDKFIRSKKLVPVFFHGSGGSVSRGGGSIKEQIAWLPQSALKIYKVTIQGETVQRHFHQPLIMRSQVAKIVNEFSHFKERNYLQPDILKKFAGNIQHAYRDLVQDPGFHHLASAATPYDFLNLLKIGSRPTKRAGTGKFTLRAIPWILCWTQTRLLLPVWWGVGSSWSQLSGPEKKKLKECYLLSPLLQSYVKQLGFTLAKMELGVWKFHVEHSGLTMTEKQRWNDLIDQELKETIDFLKALTAADSFTWFRPWLGESILFRSSMIHPLNVLQKLALERDDRILLRETVTGIACGMMTTG